MKRSSIIFVLLLPFLLFSCGQVQKDARAAKDHPVLILQKKAIPGIQKGLTIYPMLETSFLKAKDIADQGIAAGITVPFPKDPGGGYSHEKHKRNYLEMYNSGVVYQLTKEDKYAAFVRDMLLEYQKLYPTLGIHPMKKNQAPGKLFWQGLNESVWLVYSIQAYDCVYDFLSSDEKTLIEENLFRKMVEFFTVEDSYSFDRVHNHGTWAVAGVGMTGIVLEDTSMVQQALYSTKLDGSGGFLKQIDQLFSPDGYYAEGPYYQRYALMPFILFARALENNQPNLGIFEYNDGVLIKAVNTVLQLTNSDGLFYPINDAIKEKSWLTPELIFGSNIVYALSGNRSLLKLAEYQGSVMISADGLAAAKGIAEGKTEDFKRIPVLIRDGENSDRGGLALMRLGEVDDQSSVVFKFTSQGMVHGHFDRLGFLMYDKGNEIIPDYGAARFLNVTVKEGGRYLPENISWAKQTVAHTTIVIDEQSNFDFNLENAEANDPDLVFAELDNSEVQIVSATDSACYEGAVVNRTLAFFEVEGRRYLIDLFNIKNEKVSSYDLPVYYNGQILQCSFSYSKPNRYEVLGEGNGYQHLLVEARAKDLPSTSSITWRNGKGFYSMSFLSNPDTEFLVTRLGANDPNYNLRPQTGMMIRHGKAKDSKFLTVYEMHGNYNPESELVLQSEGSIQNLYLIENGEEIVEIQLELKNDTKIELRLDLSFSNLEGNYQLNY